MCDLIEEEITSDSWWFPFVPFPKLFVVRRYIHNFLNSFTLNLDKNHTTLHDFPMTVGIQVSRFSGYTCTLTSERIAGPVFSVLLLLVATRQVCYTSASSAFRRSFRFEIGACAL